MIIVEMLLEHGGVSVAKKVWVTGFFLQIFILIWDVFSNLSLNISVICFLIALVNLIIELTCFISKNKYYKIVDLYTIAMASLFSLYFAFRILQHLQYVPDAEYALFTAFGFGVVSIVKSHWFKKH